MPLFQIAGSKLSSIAQTDFADERSLQKLVEANLGAVFNSRLVASEFVTGALHGGRIDTLALSEDDNPVIIEYKRVASSELVNQSLFYLAWLQDHRGDFAIAAQKALGPNVKVDWSETRVICLAPTYRKYDLHAVQMMGANIELWSFRRFENGALYLEQVFQRDGASPASGSSGKNPLMVQAGKKAAVTKAMGGWTFQQHLNGKPDPIRDLALATQEFILNLDDSVEESPKKLYVAYRTSQNIVCMEVQKQKLLLFLKLKPDVVKGPRGISRDVSNIGHFGTGDLEVTVKTAADLEAAKPFIKQAYEAVGG
jgi:predicted transport protein